MSTFDKHKMLNRPDDDATFGEKVNVLVENIEYCAGVAGSGDDTCPTGDFQVAVDIIKRIPELFDKIAHGGPGYRQWLKEAIEAHFSGEPMPEYVDK